MANRTVSSPSNCANRRYYPTDRHPAELDPSDVAPIYGSICKGDCLEPIFHDGDCLVFSTADPAEEGDFVGLWLDPKIVGGDELPRRVKRLISVPIEWPDFSIPFQPNPGDEVEPMIGFEQLNPRKRYLIRASHIVGMHKVIGTAVPNGDGTAGEIKPLRASMAASTLA